jgi:Do/DeqQ family serine protease
MMNRILTRIVVAMALLPLTTLLYSMPRGERTSGQQQAPAAQNLHVPAEAVKNLETIQYSFREVAKKVLPVVVEIDVVEVVKQPTPQLQSPFDWFFDTPKSEGERDYRRSGLGSGIIVHRSGNRYYVITNNHVVGEAKEITVKLNDQRKFTGTLVGKDPRIDVALVYFDSKEELPVAELGDSDDMQVGDIVLAVGNPWGYESSLTMGIVSALGRRGPDSSNYTDYIQTDASINQGNSGGALVNTRGQVIGINTWIASGMTGGSIGLGFAIPINNTKKDIEGFVTSGKVQYGWLGVNIADIPDETVYPGLAKDLRISDLKGAFAWNVYKGSPADKGGLLPGDFITRFNSTDIRSSSQLTQIIGGLTPGKSYDFEVQRYGEKQKLSVKIGLRDEADTVAQYKNLWPGMIVINLTKEIREEEEIAPGVNGVVVGDTMNRETPAYIAGFKPGDVIVEINGKTVRNMLDYYKALNDKSRKDVTFKINRDGTEISIGISR